MNLSELNYNSVVTDFVAMPSSIENLPSYEARATFTVNSSTVFKEDVDITPTILLGKHAYIPWVATTFSSLPTWLGAIRCRSTSLLSSKRTKRSPLAKYSFCLNELFGIFAFSTVTDILSKMKNSVGNVEAGQDSIRIKDVARWLVKLAASDGVVSVSERKLLSEFADAFGLDKNALYRMAHGYASNVDIPEVESVSRHEMVGRKFEEFVVKLVSDKSIFRLLSWRSDKIVDGTYAAENLMPDLHLRHRLDVGEVEYFVECKFRSSLVDGVLDLGPQLNRYRRMSSGVLFIALGLGGAPSNPDKLYIIPSRMIKGDSVIHLGNFSKCLCPKDAKGFHEYISRYFQKRVF